jgi:hypothetical protein
VRIVVFRGIMFGHIQEQWNHQLHHRENFQTHTATSVSRNYISLQNNTYYIGLLSKSTLCGQGAQHNATQKYVLLLLTPFNIFDKTGVVSLYICTSIPPTKKFVSKYYDMMLGLLTSQKFWPQINTSCRLENPWKCITFLQVVWSILCNWRCSVAAGKACCWW